MTKVEMKHCAIFLALLLFLVYQLLVTAQEDVSDSCDSNLNVFLFGYNNSDWQEYIQVIENASCDIDFFWEQAPELQGHYQSPNYIVQEYSSFPFVTPTSFTGRTQNGACSIRPTFEGAQGYYCTSPYSIVVSEPTEFLHYLYWEENLRGNLSVVLFLAHEWGHHIQLSSLNSRDMPELQAECFVGAYFRYAVDNPDETLVDFSQNDWDALMQVIPIIGTDDEMVGDIERWKDISVAEQGRALRLGFAGEISSCLNTDQY